MTRDRHRYGPAPRPEIPGPMRWWEWVEPVLTGIALVVLFWGVMLLVAALP